MGLPSFATHTVTILTPGTKRVQGADVDDWAPAKVTERTITGCWVTPATTEELIGRGRDTTTDDLNVLLPPENENGTPVVPPASNEKIKVGAGHDYQVHGQVKEQPSASGDLDHYAFIAERWTNRG